MVQTGIVPAFGKDGHLPCGRYPIDMDTAYGLLVSDERFSKSKSRQRLWDGLTEYLLLFEDYQTQYAGILDGRALIRHLWLAGSYVSTKLDPQDMDVTVFTDAQAVEAVKTERGSSKWITQAFNKRKVSAEFGIEPYQVDYRAVPHAFDVASMSADEVGYFRDRGRYDDWWQRDRLPELLDNDVPTIDSCVAVRGYLEVIL